MGSSSYLGSLHWSWQVFTTISQPRTINDQKLICTSANGQKEFCVPLKCSKLILCKKKHVETFVFRMLLYIYKRCPPIPNNVSKVFSASLQLTLSTLRRKLLNPKANQNQSNNFFQHFPLLLQRRLQLLEKGAENLSQMRQQLLSLLFVNKLTT